jgi:ribosomal protein S18 acetylase RimI-like enzyme
VSEITRHGAEVLDALRPFWLAMVHHHAEVAAEMGAPRDDDESWARRRAYYAQALAEPGAFVLLAGPEGERVGYAVVRYGGASHTFAEPARHGVLESLALLPGTRGQGVGEQLVAAAQREIEADGVGELRLEAFAANAPALRFYERLGFRPYLVALRRPG